MDFVQVLSEVLGVGGEGTTKMDVSMSHSHLITKFTKNIMLFFRFLDCGILR